MISLQTGTISEFTLYLKERRVINSNQYIFQFDNNYNQETITYSLTDLSNGEKYSKFQIDLYTNPLAENTYTYFVYQLGTNSNIQHWNGNEYITTGKAFVKN